LQRICPLLTQSGHCGSFKGHFDSGISIGVEDQHVTIICLLNCAIYTSMLGNGDAANASKLRSCRQMDESTFESGTFHRETAAKSKSVINFGGSERSAPLSAEFAVLCAEDIAQSFHLIEHPIEGV
jgi:hypothetical protein